MKFDNSGRFGVVTIDAIHQVERRINETPPATTIHRTEGSVPKRYCTCGAPLTARNVRIAHASWCPRSKS